MLAVEGDGEAATVEEKQNNNRDLRLVKKASGDSSDERDN